MESLFYIWYKRGNSASFFSIIGPTKLQEIRNGIR